MAEKDFPLNKEQLEAIIEKHPTPFHLYDEKGIRQTARSLNAAFEWAPDFKEYFALKATPNPRILEILKQEGCGADCSSGAELVLSERAGVTGEDIMFTSNDTPWTEYQKARDLGAVLNLDDISHIAYVEEHCGLPELISFRYNPGKLRAGNAIIGEPTDAKYGLTREQIFEAFAACRDKGVRRFGLHTMVASNELDPRYFVETARMLMELALELHREKNIRMEFINMGGGIGVAYRPEETPVSFTEVGEGVRQVYQEIIAGSPLDPLKICMENGRVITGPHGWLVSRVLHRKDTYKTFVGLDSCMADLMRPAIYGAYHHITIPGKDQTAQTEVCDVTGSLCENNDKFAIDRTLPVLEPGDLVVIHDAGAHGYAMGFNYNGKLRSAELLLKENGEIEKIRRAERLEDLFATLNFA